MQNIPVDVARLGTLMCVVPPEPKVNKETGEIRTDREGNALYVVGISVRQKEGRRAEVIEIAVPGQPSGIAEGMRVTVTDLIAVAWEIDGRKGTSYRASAITPATTSPPAGSGSAGGGSRGKASGGGDA